MKVFFFSAVFVIVLIGENCIHHNILLINYDRSSFFVGNFELSVCAACIGVLVLKVIVAAVELN